MRKTTSRIISTCLALLLALTSLASMVQPAAAQETDLRSYDVQTFYNGLAPDESEQGTIVEIDQVGNLWQYGYYNDTVGYQLFNNLFYDENLWQMTQDAPSANAANWDYGDYALPGRYIYPAASYDSAVTFNAPMDGTVMIASTGAWVGGGSEDGVRIVIYAGNTKIWPTDSEWCDINSSNSNSVMKTIDFDSPFMQFLSRCSDLIILNVLWFLCCLPVVTAGAATTALYRL